MEEICYWLSFAGMSFVFNPTFLLLLSMMFLIIYSRFGCVCFFTGFVIDDIFVVLPNMIKNFSVDLMLLLFILKFLLLFWFLLCGC